MAIRADVLLWDFTPENFVPVERADNDPHFTELRESVVVDVNEVVFRTAGQSLQRDALCGFAGDVRRVLQTNRRIFFAESFAYDLELRFVQGEAEPYFTLFFGEAYNLLKTIAESRRARIGGSAEKHGKRPVQNQGKQRNHPATAHIDVPSPCSFTMRSLPVYASRVKLSCAH